jgi:hypothetical protein
MNYYVMRDSIMDDAVGIIRLAGADAAIPNNSFLRFELCRLIEQMYDSPFVNSFKKITQAEWESWREMELFPAFEATLYIRPTHIGRVEIDSITKL